MDAPVVLAPLPPPRDSSCRRFKYARRFASHMRVRRSSLIAGATVPHV